MQMQIIIPNPNRMLSLESLSKDSILLRLEINYAGACMYHKITLSLISL